MALTQEIIDYVREQGGGAYRVPMGDVIGAVPKYSADGTMEDILHFFVVLPRKDGTTEKLERIVQNRQAFKFVSGIVRSVDDFKELINGTQ